MRSRCPVCHKIVTTSGTEETEDAEFFPFCCERCKLIDLGAWLDAEYKIASEQPSEESADPSDTTSPSDSR
ncbi:MAG TPA: DNA gyrase inhibitor YacG [Sedimentisphaerales bacterium]|nr:DNA gyrase inhibitor YacG [Sedimentisphaerales bacterium]